MCWWGTLGLITVFVCLSTTSKCTVKSRLSDVRFMCFISLIVMVILKWFCSFTKQDALIVMYCYEIKSRHGRHSQEPFKFISRCFMTVLVIIVHCKGRSFTDNFDIRIVNFILGEKRYDCVNYTFQSVDTVMLAVGGIRHPPFVQ